MVTQCTTQNLVFREINYKYYSVETKKSMQLGALTQKFWPILSSAWPKIFLKYSGFLKGVGIIYIYKFFFTKIEDFLHSFEENRD